MSSRLKSWIMLILVLLVLPGSPPGAQEWELAAEIPEAQYTYDLMTTPGAVYLVLADSLENALGLYRYDCSDGELEFVGCPAEPLYGVHVAGENEEHIWLGSKDAGILWYSSDSGDNWIPRQGVDDAPMYAVAGSKEGDQLYVSAKFHLCFQTSRDFGGTWYSYGMCNPAVTSGTRCLEVDAFDRNRAYAYASFSPTWSTRLHETTDGGRTWNEEWGAVQDPCGAGLYPSPFQSGDLGFVDSSGEVTFRSDGEWGYLEDTALGVVYGLAQPVWDAGAWWIAGVGLDDRIHVGRNDGGGWVEWSQGLAVVDFGEDGYSLYSARMWADLESGDVFISLPGEGLWVYRNPTASAPTVTNFGQGPWALGYPNPAPGEVTLILGDIPASNYELTVYDVRGRRVAGLFEGSLEGRSVWRWDGRDGAGQEVSSGLYILALTDGSGLIPVTEKILLRRP
ncbi:MAG: T9SS type A sorting domain-containing protein [Candidatus Eisenbacteria bacterium]|nr:T9SS type A sorting domain-containing protein [Candidatus Eisenbacteria bacterium]